MSKNYDNWERLVDAVLQREQFRQLALAHSRESSISSLSSSFNLRLNSQIHCRASNFMPLPPATDPKPSSSTGPSTSTPGLKIFTFAELKRATRNFKYDIVVGTGLGCGTGYKVWIDSKTLVPSKVGTRMPVAIKTLNLGSRQDFEEWKSGCLENHLFRRIVANETLSWDLRLKIAIGAAKGLCFLHSLDKQVIYRDFKASSMLLDGNYNAKLSDFGLAKLGPSEGNSHITTQIMGTHGYAAPEYVATGHLYVKSDVYGVGVVLLEMLTGLCAVDIKRPSGRQNLVDYAQPFLCKKKKLMSIMDGRMEGQYSSKAALQAAQLTLRCLDSVPKKRPSTREVVEALEQIAAIGKPKESKSKSMHSSSHHHHHRDRVASGR